MTSGHGSSFFRWGPRAIPPSQAIRTSPARVFCTGSGRANLVRDIRCDGEGSTPATAATARCPKVPEVLALRDSGLGLCACVLPILRGFDARRFLVQASRRVPVMHSKARESDRSKPGGLNPAPRCLTPMGAERTLQAACTEGALTDSAQCGGAHPVRGDFPLDVTARPATRSPG
ncbi:MAG: hypothetical protein BWY17_04712 [Deltaproteobacteria bacterium ADurb.Bin207]|nr:MAG: hypothetical protein BWY17_04712 [Deltaproteobacteria bacterium ADurb.Bin207]